MADGEPRDFSRIRRASPFPQPLTPHELDPALEVPSPELPTAPCDREQLWSLCTQNQSQWISKLLGWGVPTVPDAEDILGDVILRVAEVVDLRIAAIRNPEAWLTRLLQRRSIDLLRRRRRHAATFAALPCQRRPEHDHPEALVGAEELRQLAETAFLELPIVQRQVLLARTERGFSYQQIAEFQSCSLTAARKRYQYARQRITHALEAGGLPS